MKFTFLGTGTSQGVPVIACNCNICLSEESYNKRLRSSGLISSGSTNILIDSGPDLREQMLNCGVKKINAVLITHEHNDHIIGLDDLRPFIFLSKDRELPLYGMPRVLNEIKSRFSYAFYENPYPGAPRFSTHPLEFNLPMSIGEIEFSMIPVMHGELLIAGYRFKNFAYITDCKSLSRETIESLESIETLVISALRLKDHHSHMTLEESLEIIEKIKPQKAFITHISHLMGDINKLKHKLPEGVEFAYDGLALDL